MNFSYLSENNIESASQNLRKGESGGSNLNQKEANPPLNSFFFHPISNLNLAKENITNPNYSKPIEIYIEVSK